MIIPRHAEACTRSLDPIRDLTDLRLFINLVPNGCDFCCRLVFAVNCKLVRVTVARLWRNKSRGVKSGDHGLSTKVAAIGTGVHPFLSHTVLFFMTFRGVIFLMKLVRTD